MEEKPVLGYRGYLSLTVLKLAKKSYPRLRTPFLLQLRRDGGPDYLHEYKIQPLFMRKSLSSLDHIPINYLGEISANLPILLV